MHNGHWRSVGRTAPCCQETNSTDGNPAATWLTRMEILQQHDLPAALFSDGNQLELHRKTYSVGSLEESQRKPTVSWGPGLDSDLPLQRVKASYLFPLPRGEREKQARPFPLFWANEQTASFGHKLIETAQGPKDLLIPAFLSSFLSCCSLFIATGKHLAQVFPWSYFVQIVGGWVAKAKCST